MKDRPFFMTNEEWYIVDENDDDYGYKLTEVAPQDAIDSYNEFYDESISFSEEELPEEFKRILDNQIFD